MERKNCWEIKKCGRYPGGEKVEELGVCPAARPSEYDGTNKGMYGGRFCWAIAGTFCGGTPRDTFAQKFMTCLHCEVFTRISEEEGRNLVLVPEDLKNKLR